MNMYSTLEVTIEVMDTPIRVQFEYESADRSVGLDECTTIKYTWIGEHDVTDMLSDYVMECLYEKLDEKRREVDTDITAAIESQFRGTR